MAIFRNEESNFWEDAASEAAAVFWRHYKWDEFYKKQRARLSEIERDKTLSPERRQDECTYLYFVEAEERFQQCRRDLMGLHEKLEKLVEFLDDQPLQPNSYRGLEDPEWKDAPGFMNPEDPDSMPPDECAKELRKACKSMATGLGNLIFHHLR